MGQFPMRERPIPFEFRPTLVVIVLKTPVSCNPSIVVFAGDVTPIEIMCHLPAVCEEKDLPYCYIPSRKDLGTAMGVKRGSLMVLIREHGEYKELYDEVKESIKELPPPE
uniref:Ribosomal protein eL8/eL30/eS12/Gadd45 domain-containing protein n=1 Tax=Timema shepardi TaxID=629360 RepID=A0A7R9B5T9_TIMSH|nr:unnamed protein product [Timema shepardi]